MPKSKDILDATKLVEPGQKERLLKMTAPKQTGDYEYFCTCWATGDACGAD